MGGCLGTGAPAQGRRHSSGGGGGGGGGGGLQLRGDSDDEGDRAFKIVMIGPMSCGKTSIVNRLCHDEFSSRERATVGMAFAQADVTVSLGGQERTIALALFDTAGQERFRAHMKSYYRAAPGAVLVFEVTSAESLRSAIEWLDVYRDMNPGGTVVLCGNKTDLPAPREVSASEGAREAAERRCLYCETSAATGAGVREMFRELALSMAVRRATGR
uniref:GTP-binding protein n=1 Tax=Bicosoecida sp. CB-2014 TaxID=1486930 RepID=A0A7S1GCA3_9STRA|mmetsp:Transcript_6427/g.22925  ORF Transcript_6427/g.22925 Transcript_6427/m.22925 type:complete len:216 (+) Transcript_6427:352-999(+)